MIRYRIERQGRSALVFLGLSDANITRLRAGQPIRIDASDPATQLEVELVIYHGATEVDLTRELEENGLLPEGAAARTAQAMADRSAYVHQGDGRAA
jgi:hypothetical protein